MEKRYPVMTKEEQEQAALNFQEYLRRRDTEIKMKRKLRRESPLKQRPFQQLSKLLEAA